MEDTPIDKLFTSFLKLMVKFIRLFVPKPKFGNVDMKKSDVLSREMKDKNE